MDDVKQVGLTPFQNNLLALIDSVIGYTTNDAVNVTKAIADHPEILLGLIGEAHLDVVLRALGGRQAGHDGMASPLHMTGDCWRFPKRDF